MKDRIPIAQWPQLFDAALRRSAVFNRMVAEIAYGNVRFAFELARAKTIGDVMKLQADYWRNLFTVLQGREFREAFFPFGVPGAPAAPAASAWAESPKPESAKAESAKSESAKAESAKPESERAFAQPSVAPGPVMTREADEPKIAPSPIAASPVKAAAAAQPKIAATRAAATKTKSERPKTQSEKPRPERHRTVQGGARKATAARKRPAPQEATPGGRAEIRFARLDDNAVRFTGKEAWRLRNGTWRKIPVAKVADEAVVLSKARFDQLFTKVPKLPAGAFKRERD